MENPSRAFRMVFPNEMEWGVHKVPNMRSLDEHLMAKWCNGHAPMRSLSNAWAHHILHAQAASSAGASL